MPRSANDATRFTATGPYASTKADETAPKKGSRIDPGNAPAGETPQQRIARLRAAAQIARHGKETTFDRVVRVGRVWADRAHRVTTLGLLGLTGVSVLVAAAGITDIVLHNRQRRRDWYAEQDLKRKAEIERAQAAVADGSVTQDQLLLLGQERAKAEAAERKKNKPGFFKSTTNYLFGGLQKEEQKGGKLGAAFQEAKLSQATADASESGAAVLRFVDEKAADLTDQVNRTASSISPTGGPLDRAAQHLTDTAVAQTQSWQKWLLRQA